MEIVNLVQQCLQQALEQQLPATPPLMAPIPSKCLPVLDEISQPSSNFSAKSVISDITIQTMQQQMQIMQKIMEMMQVTNKLKKPRRCNPYLTKYSHTYGLCNHDSPDCQTPAEGHKNEATLQNYMGGSTKNNT